ncbi:hypothetical protein ACFP81_06420 [Deinococcus lacus]|uniref:Helix-hairpin-helix domain-containing protein n=1 Tax=Deinococcus lacus TaxID=392561 RepID=A0ABW1YER9_9DEIO
MSKASEAARARMSTDVQRVPTIQPAQAVNRAKQQASVPTPPIDKLSPNGVADTNAAQDKKAVETNTALDAGKLGNGLYELLTEAGYENAEQVAGATDDQLLAIKGVGDKSLAEIRAVYPANAPQGVQSEAEYWPNRSLRGLRHARRRVCAKAPCRSRDGSARDEARRP